MKRDRGGKDVESERSRRRSQPKVAGEDATEFEDSRTSQGSPDEQKSVEEEVLPVSEEHARVETRPVERDRVRVRTEPTERTETTEARLTRTNVEVERVPVGRKVDAPEPVREEGDTTVIPVHEEVLVVTKQLVLKEEVHLRRREEEHTESVDVSLRSEKAIVERTSAEEEDRETD